jgi:hypothetical protein
MEVTPCISIPIFLIQKKLLRKPTGHGVECLADRSWGGSSVEWIVIFGAETIIVVLEDGRRERDSLRIR